jgi:hypothetical protein
MSDTKNLDVSSLGASFRVGNKSLLSFNPPGTTQTFKEETVEVSIGIGDNHSAKLIMDMDSWEALREGAPVSIETLQGYIKKIKKNGRKG